MNSRLIAGICDFQLHLAYMRWLARVYNTMRSIPGCGKKKSQNMLSPISLLFVEERHSSVRNVVRHLGPSFQCIVHCGNYSRVAQG